MANSVSTLLIAVANESAIIKVTGRANFTTSVTFKRLFGELRDRGFARFVLDLTECVTMDSTFLGVLAGTALKLAEIRARAINGEAGMDRARGLHLLNPNPRILDLLDNLGISDLFQTTNCGVSPEAPPSLECIEGDSANREEVAKTCLEAHQLLMNLNPDNIPRFKDVAQFLAEDLERIKMERAAGEREQPSPTS